MDVIEIENGVPLPKDGRGRKDKYPFAKMEVGQSCLVTDVLGRAMGARVAYYKKKTGFRFTIRQVEGGVRVWRVE